MRFRWVFFDAGETLVHPAPSFPELFATIVTREGFPRDAADIQRGAGIVSEAFGRAADRHTLWTTTPEGSQRFWNDVYGSFLEVLEIPDGDGLPATLYREFTDLANYAAFDDVAEVLADLRARGVRLGVISNFEPWLDELLDRLGLRDVFDVRVISGNEGVEKPDPAIFRLALERAGPPPEEAAHVGDMPTLDVDPSASVGMFPVLIDRRARHPDFAGPGARITTMADLLDVLEAS